MSIQRTTRTINISLLLSETQPQLLGGFHHERPSNRIHLLDGLRGPQMTDALMSYVRRAQKGVTDAALVTGTGKDLLEATAKHVLLERKGACPETTFPVLLGLAFVELGLVTPQHPKQPGESAQNELDRALFDVGCAVNRIRNKQGTGHGRPWPPSINEDEARECTELMGIIAGRLLSKL